MFNRRQLLGGGASVVVAGSGTRAHSQAAKEITISRQPGILYMPLHVIEKYKLIEKHAERLGVAGTVKWVSFSNGGAQQEALISGNVDIITTGTGNLLLLWDRTKGGVKGIAAISAALLTFISRDPRITSLTDIAAGDKIAVPTVKVSTQAILLQMAAAKLFGPEHWAKLDPHTVQLGHPDAFIAMKNPTHEVRSHFAAPPYDFYELREVPGARKVLDSAEIIGGPLTQGQFFTTTKYAEANPTLIQAVRAAAEEAKALIASALPNAIEAYREINNDKTPPQLVADILKEPGMQDWNLHPQGTMKFAAHLHRFGTLKTMPSSWTDYYLPAAHDLPGS